jgi:hypothetical protein
VPRFVVQIWRDGDAEPREMTVEAADEVAALAVLVELGATRGDGWRVTLAPARDHP